MVKIKFAKIITATLVALMIMGMTVVANAEDDNNNATPAQQTIIQEVVAFNDGEVVEAPAMNANLLVKEVPVAADAPAAPAANQAPAVENVSDEAVPQASAADESHTSWLWLIILIVAVAAAITGYTIYRKNKSASDM